MTMAWRAKDSSTSWFVAAAIAFGIACAVAQIPARARAEENPASPASPELQAALASALTIPGARADIVSLEKTGGDCVTDGPTTRMEAARPIDGSGRVALKLTGVRSTGRSCEVWAWARIKVFAAVPVARRAIRAGEGLADAVRTEEREIKPGHVPATVTAASIAERSLGAGQMIEAEAVRAPGPRAGETVKVLIVSGALVIEQLGRVVSCGRGHVCAVLPSGKHIEGTLENGRLKVDLP
jgi:hypothetical protein